MATDKCTIDQLLDCLSAAGIVRAKPMFGEYGIYCDDRFIGVVCDNQFHLKPTKAGLSLAPELDLQPAYAGAKPSIVIPGDRWDDADWITNLVQITSQNLPAPKARK